MPAVSYSEFEWNTTAPGNGASGLGLADLFLRLITSLSEVGSICDLGCGNGYLAGQLASRGYRVVAIDASESGIELARQSYSNVTFVKEIIDAQLMRRAALESFDLVISSDVIEHLYRPADLIEAASSILSPKGQILIGTPYHGYLKNLALGITGKMDSHFSVLDTGGHIKFFSVRTLSELLTTHGFEELRFSFYGRAPYLWKNMVCHARKR